MTTYDQGLKTIVEDFWEKEDFQSLPKFKDYKEFIEENTKFLDENYDKVPFRSRAYVIKNDITEETIPKCACGCGRNAALKLEKPIEGFAKFAHCSCVNNVKIPKEIKELLNNKEWMIEQRVNQKKTIDTIAKELNVSDFVVKNSIKEHKINELIDSKLGSLETREILSSKEKMTELYNQGLSTRKIGAMIGTSKNTVKSWLIRHGIIENNKK